MRAILFLSLALASAAGAAEQLQCPASVSIEKSAIAPPGWRVFSGRAPHTLQRVGMYDGDPNADASLVPDRVVEAARESRDEWRLPVARQEAAWVACFYAGTGMYLARPLDRGVSRCSARYLTTATGLRLGVTSLACD
ncbi:MAG: hypothetical protein KJZ83_16500 [Burkholderiaceae bacterium]|nr:hypothetical protein [Burkholderiaceae bacterium]